MNKIKLEAKNKAIHHDGIFREILALMWEADILLEFDSNGNGLEDMDAEDREYLFSKDSICGEFINIDDFVAPKNSRRLVERLIMHVIVPEIVVRYHDEHDGRGSNRSGINDFFRDLGHEDNKYELTRIKDDYCIGMDTVKRGYDKDLYKHRGDPTHDGIYMWRKKPEK